MWKGSVAKESKGIARRMTSCSPLGRLMRSTCKWRFIVSLWAYELIRSSWGRLLNDTQSNTSIIPNRRRPPNMSAVLIRQVFIQSLPRWTTYHTLVSSIIQTLFPINLVLIFIIFHIFLIIPFYFGMADLRWIRNLLPKYPLIPANKTRYSWTF